MKKLFVILAGILMFTVSINAQTIFYVIKTGDPDPFLHPYNYVDSLCDTTMYGTLQWAERKVNDTPGPCEIHFAIAGAGQHTIYLLYELPVLINATKIDGTTQPGYQYGSPTIIIDGQNLINTGIYYYNVTNSVIKGLQIQNFSLQGIVLYRCTSAEISDNIINRINNESPFDATTGIRLINTNNTHISGNFIGTNYTLNSGNGCDDYGILVQYYVFPQQSNGDNNFIGGSGVNEGNTIAYNGVLGISIGMGSSNNLISRNRLFNNPTAIYLIMDANLNKQAPVITSATANIVSGTSAPNDIIEVFGSTGNENANEYLTTTIADSSGSWTAQATTTYQNVIATATDDSNNTSALSLKYEKACGNLCVFLNYTISPWYFNGMWYYYVWPDTCLNDFTICLGDTIYFSAIDCFVNSYNFTFTLNGIPENYPNVFVGHELNELYFYVPTSVGVYTYYGVNNDESSIFFSGTFTVESAISTPTASNTGPYCEGDTIQLNVTAATSYNWSGPSGFTSILQNPTIPGATLAMGGVYSVTVTNASGCTAIATTTVTVNDLPIVSATNNGPVCIGKPLTLTGGTSGMPSYSWSGPLGFSSNSQSPMVSSSATAVMAGVYTITVTNANGCTATASTTVTVNALPTANAGSDQTICSGLSATLTATGGGIGGTYLWNTTAITPTIIVTPAITTTYTVTVTGTNGCTATDQVTIFVNPLPSQPSFTVPTCISSAVPVSFTSTSTDATSWFWDFGDPAPGSNNTSTLQNPSHTYSSPGNYIVYLTVSNICGSASTSQIITVISDCCASSSYVNYTAGYYTTTVTYTSSSTWTSNLRIAVPVIVKAPYVLTVNAGVTIEFGPLGKIIVENGTLTTPGAQLVMQQNSNLTSITNTYTLS